MKKKLAYLNKDVSRDDIEALKWFSIDVEIGHTKVYHGHDKLYEKLSPMARVVLDHICAIMDEENIIKNNRRFKASFRRKWSKKNYADNSINRAFRELYDSALLDDTGTRGTYRVNPLFLWNGSEKKRMKLLREILEEPYTTMIKEQRHQRLKKMSNEQNKSPGPK